MIDGHGYQYFPLGMRDYHGDDEEGVDDTHVRGNTDQPCDKAKPNHGDNLGGQNCHFLSQRPFLFLLVACLRLESWRVKDVLKAGKAECAGWLALVDWSRRKRRSRSRWGACALVPVGRVVEKPSHAGQVNRATTVRHFFPTRLFFHQAVFSAHSFSTIHKVADIYIFTTSTHFLSLYSFCVLSWTCTFAQDAVVKARMTFFDAIQVWFAEYCSQSPSPVSRSSLALTWISQLWRHGRTFSLCTGLTGDASHRCKHTVGK